MQLKFEEASRSTRSTRERVKQLIKEKKKRVGGKEKQTE